MVIEIFECLRASGSLLGKYFDHGGELRYRVLKVRAFCFWVLV